jgi:hypothetical protein
MLTVGSKTTTWRGVWRGEGAGEAGRSDGLVPVSGDRARSVQCGGAAGTASRRRGPGGSTARRRAIAGPLAESTGRRNFVVTTRWEMEGTSAGG